MGNHYKPRASGTDSPNGLRRADGTWTHNKFCHCFRCHPENRRAPPDQGTATTDNLTWERLVEKVEKNELGASAPASDLEAALDKFIIQHRVAWVIDEQRFWVWYQRRYRKHWVRLNKVQMESECPGSFAAEGVGGIPGSARKPTEHPPILRRLHAIGRVFRTVEIHHVRFI